MTGRLSQVGCFSIATVGSVLLGMECKSMGADGTTRILHWGDRINLIIQPTFFRLSNELMIQGLRGNSIGNEG